MQYWVTKLVLIATVAVSLTAAVRVVRKECRPTPQFDRAALETWLATGSVEKTETARVRRAMRMLEQDFQADYDWRPYYQSLGPTERTRFRRNFMELALQSFRQRAALYVAARPYERQKILDAQLAELMHWYLLDSQGRKLQSLELFTDKELTAKLNAEKPTRVSDDGNGPTVRLAPSAEFLRDLRDHVLQKALGRFMPGGPPGEGERERRED